MKKTARVYIESDVAPGDRRGWWKAVTSVDRSQRGGYCLRGDWVHDGECDIPLGTVLVEARHEGTVDKGWKSMRVYLVTENGPERRGDESEPYSMSRSLPTLLDVVEAALLEGAGLAGEGDHSLTLAQAVLLLRQRINLAGQRQSVIRSDEDKYSPTECRELAAALVECSRVIDHIE